MTILHSSEIDFKKLLISTGNITSNTIFISRMNGEVFELSQILENLQDFCESFLNEIIFISYGELTNEEIKTEAQKTIDHVLFGFELKH